MDNQTPATGGEFMLFGVRVVVDSMRKSVSLNNLSQYEHRLDSSSSNDQKDKEKDVIAAGYASADEAIPHSSTAAATTTGSGVSRERKRGVPWTEEEHKLFLIGLQKVGKGDWRGISRNFVKTRTPTQVASHAQKYFLRRSNLNRRRRRSSLFDITTDSVAGNSSSEEQMVKENNNNVATSQSPPPPPQQPPEQQILSNVRSYQHQNHHHPIYPVVSFSQAPQAPDHQRKSMADFDLNENSLSLNLSLSMSPADLTNSSTTTSSRHSGFQLMQGFGNGDSIISVA